MPAFVYVLQDANVATGELAKPRQMSEVPPYSLQYTYRLLNKRPTKQFSIINSVPHNGSEMEREIDEWWIENCTFFFFSCIFQKLLKIIL